MKNLVSITFLVFLLCTLELNAQSIVLPQSVTIEYTSPFCHIYMVDGEFIYTNHDSSSELLSMEMRQNDLQDLYLAITEVGFLELDDQYGAPEGEVHDSYRITVIQGDQKKAVIFRSNVNNNLQPDVFSDAEVLLNEFAEGMAYESK